MTSRRATNRNEAFHEAQERADREGERTIVYLRRDLVNPDHNVWCVRGGSHERPVASQAPRFFNPGDELPEDLP